MSKTIFVLTLLATLALPVHAAGQVTGSPGQPAEGAPPEEPPFSPRGAFFRSIVLPGWGQAYVGARGRGAVYFSLAGGSVWMTYVARRQLVEARREQTWLRETGALQPTEETEFALARARHFEDWAALSIFLFFLSGADAYVAAYLADFQERIGVAPTPEGGVRLETMIPLGRGR